MVEPTVASRHASVVIWVGALSYVSNEKKRGTLKLTHAIAGDTCCGHFGSNDAPAAQPGLENPWIRLLMLLG